MFEVGVAEHHADRPIGFVAPDRMRGECELRSCLALYVDAESDLIVVTSGPPSDCAALSRRLRFRAWQSRNSWLHAPRLLTIALPPRAGRPRRMSG